MINIPIYRAKKIDSDEYVIGMLTKRVFTSYLLIRNDITTKLSKIDPTTLAISFDNSKSFIKLSDLEIHTCTDFELKYTDMKMRDRKKIQSPNGNIFTIITDKGR